MNYPWKQDAINHAKKCDPEESCGIVAIKNKKQKYYPCRNISNEFKVNSFVINPLDYAAVEDATDKIIGIVHSHPDGDATPSTHDKIF